MRELLIGPLLALISNSIPVNHPRVILIDALDECYDRVAQRELLRVTKPPTLFDFSSQVAQKHTLPRYLIIVMIFRRYQDCNTI